MNNEKTKHDSSFSLCWLASCHPGGWVVRGELGYDTWGQKSVQTFSSLWNEQKISFIPDYSGRDKWYSGGLVTEICGREWFDSWASLAHKIRSCVHCSVAASHVSSTCTIVNSQRLVVIVQTITPWLVAPIMTNRFLPLAYGAPTERG